jgi:16S rRNA A1518/A1519 N6-dimethyltransferase RsmA/KsgA/DIM1 with predicted DNA glycosylase/AP lyase activity
MGQIKKRQHKRKGSRTLAQARLGQHFFTSKSIAKKIVGAMNLNNQQVALDLGAGEGFFTNLIAPEVKFITAIDIDKVMVSRLNERFRDSANVKVVGKSIKSAIDFGKYDVIFGNIPFNSTAEIFRKIVKPPIRFKSCHLIVETDAAYRLVGSTRPTEMALLAYPNLEIELGMSVPRWAYSPQPAVNTSVLHFRARKSGLISSQDAKDFRLFVKAVIRSGSRKLYRVLGDGISVVGWRNMCARANVGANDSHLDMVPEQYVALFLEIAHHRSVASGR